MLIKLWIQIHVKCFEINSSLQMHFFLYLYDFEHFFRTAHYLVSIYKYKSGTNLFMILNFILTGNLRHSNTTQNFLTIEEVYIFYKLL